MERELKHEKYPVGTNTKGLNLKQYHYAGKKDAIEMGKQKLNCGRTVGSVSERKRRTNRLDKQYFGVKLI